MTRLLLVDDDPGIRQATATLLRSRGYAVLAAATATEALAEVDRDRPGLVVVDLGLPDMEGAELVRRIRVRTDAAILVLSVRGDERSKVSALDAGADDYVTKPFGADELLARIRAALRRVGSPALQGSTRHGDLTIDFDRHRVLRGDLDLRLAPKEFQLLALLAAHHGRVLTHDKIARSIWGATGAAQHEHLRVLVGQLRKKLEPEPSSPRYIVTEPWVGYRFAAEGA